MSGISTNKNRNLPAWDELEVVLATKIVEESKRKSRRWFTAWLVTTAALVASNLAWVFGEIK